MLLRSAWTEEFRSSLDADSDADADADDASADAAGADEKQARRPATATVIGTTYDDDGEEMKSPSPLPLPQSTAAAAPAMSGLVRDLNNPKSIAFVAPPTATTTTTAATATTAANDSNSTLAEATLTFTKSWNLLSAQLMAHRNAKEHAQRLTSTAASAGASASGSDLTPILYTPLPTVTEDFLVAHAVYMLFGLTSEVFGLTQVSDTERRVRMRRAVGLWLAINPSVCRLVCSTNFVSCVLSLIYHRSRCGSFYAVRTHSTVQRCSPRLLRYITCSVHRFFEFR